MSSFYREQGAFVMIRTLILAAGLLLAACQSEARSGASAEAQTFDIPVITGAPNFQNANRFIGAVSSRTDQIVGLKLRVEKNSSEVESATGFSARQSDEGYLLISYYVEGEGYEVLINGGYGWQNGGWDVDGFYIVKPGGSHQGQASFGLRPVDDAQVRLNPAVRFHIVSFE